MLVLRISSFQGATIRPIVPKKKRYCLNRSPPNFKIFFCAPLKPNVKSGKENTNTLDAISIVYFL